MNMRSKHSEYPITNGEWVMNKGFNTLCSYLANRLDIRVSDERKNFIRFAGIVDYYIRNEYGYEYGSCKSVGGVERGRAVLDPWNRCFKVFPYERRNMGVYEYEGYYSNLVNRVGFDNGVVNKLPKDQVKHNVMLITTSVNGYRVYCVDILSGVYEYR